MDRARVDRRSFAPDVPPPTDGDRYRQERQPVHRDLPVDRLPPAAAGVESRPAEAPVAYTHRPGAFRLPKLDGGHVRIVRGQPSPEGIHEHSEVSQPQRPTFRAPPEPWTDPITPDS